jgi:hypothetical protein
METVSTHLYSRAGGRGGLQHSGLDRGGQTNSLGCTRGLQRTEGEQGVRGALDISTDISTGIHGQLMTYLKVKPTLAHLEREIKRVKRKKKQDIPTT